MSAQVALVMIAWKRELGGVARFAVVLNRTRCHGVCHGPNARIRAAGLCLEGAVVLDFDDAE